MLRSRSLELEGRRITASANPQLKRLPVRQVSLWKINARLPRQ